MDQPLTPASAPLRKPDQLNAVAILTLISGVLNVATFFGLACGLGSLLLLSVVGIVCLPLLVYPLVLGILEIVYAAKLLPNPPQPVKPARYLAVMEICGILFGNIISAVIGILALVFYSDPTVQAYMDRVSARSSAIVSASSQES